jgi:hypothetical protein
LFEIWKAKSGPPEVKRRPGMKTGVTHLKGISRAKHLTVKGYFRVRRWLNEAGTEHHPVFYWLAS